MGLSPSGLRRLAEIYSQVRGELPRDPRSRTRLWPTNAALELAAARRLVQSGRAASTRDALESLPRIEDWAASISEAGELEWDQGGAKGQGANEGSDLDELISQLLAPSLRPDTKALARLTERVEALALELENRATAIEESIERLRSELLQQGQLLAGAIEGGPSRSQAPRPTAGADRQASDDHVPEVARLRRRLRYLQAELEARGL